MKKAIIIIIVIIAIGALAFFMVKASSRNVLGDLLGNQKEDTGVINPKTQDKLLGDKAPYFDLSGVDGKRIKSGEFIDKPLVVIFWASWNVESANQLKIIDDYILSNKNDLVSVVSINSQEDISIVKSFVRRGGYEVTTAVDANGGTTEDYHIKSLPTSFFIDKDGVIREIYSGVLNKDMFMSKIEQLLD